MSTSVNSVHLQQQAALRPPMVRPAISGNNNIKVRSVKASPERNILDKSFFTGANDHFNIQSYAFKDRLGRDCHIINPKRRNYNNFHDFSKNASKAEKLDVFRMIEKIGKDTGGFKFVIEKSPKTKNMLMYVASAKDVKTPDVRWEHNGETYKNQPGSKTNNPLYEKSKSGLTTTLDETKHFVRFTTPKPNHDLICPKQHAGYEDIMHFIKDTPDDRKLELLDILHKNAEPDNKIYVNSGKARRIPWMHVHMLYGDDHKKRKF